jgi:hypothetical protein
MIVSKPMPRTVTFTIKNTPDGSVGIIRPVTVRVRIALAATFKEQKFKNNTKAPVTIIFPCGLSPDGCIFGVAPGETLSIRISACAPRRIEIPYWVFFADKNVRDWGRAASPPTMVIEP